MGEIERKVKQRRRNRQLRQIILGVVRAAGVLSIALLAPKAMTVFVKLGLIPKTRQKEIISLTRKKMVRVGLLKYENGYLKLTAKGEAKMDELELKNFCLAKPKKWDQKWRVIIFDIPERKRGLRQKIRVMLSSVGFLRLQDSVWVYPYPCDDFITLLKADSKIGRDLLYLVVESIENDKWLKENFGLK